VDADLITPEPRAVTKGTICFADRALHLRYRFNDPYTALNKIQLGYIGNRSIVFHDASAARIACATLVKVETIC
jgi:hypothetical protein